MSFFCYTGHGSEVSLSLLESTGSILEFFTVETRPLFDVFFRGYIAKVEDQAISEVCLLGFNTELKGQETEGQCKQMRGERSGGLMKHKVNN